MTDKTWRILLGAAAALGLAIPALAQQGMPPPGPPPAGYNGEQPSPAEQSDRFRQALRLRPDQEGALQAFVAAMQPVRGGQAERLREAARREATLPTLQRLDAMTARMDEARAMFMARIAATRAFYAQLTPAQQAIFDRMPPPGQGMR